MWAVINLIAHAQRYITYQQGDEAVTYIIINMNKYNNNNHHRNRQPSRGIERRMGGGDRSKSFHRKNQHHAPPRHITRHINNENQHSNSTQVTARRRIPQHQHSSFLNVKGCQSIEELIKLVSSKGRLPPHYSAFWSRFPQLLATRRISAKPKQKVKQRLLGILVRTMSSINQFGTIDITATIHGIAKICEHRWPLLQGVVYDDNFKPKTKMFHRLAVASLPIITRFDTRHLSNLLHAFSLIDYIPVFDDGSSLFDHIARYAVQKLESFTSQDISVMMTAFAKSKVSNSLLFSKVADLVIARELLKTFYPREISNLIWAYATAGESKANKSLFKEVAKDMMRRDLNGFGPQVLSVIVWAYAKAGKACSVLFDRIADSAIARHQQEFTTQGVANLLWAFAMYGGKVNVHLFQSFVPAIESKIGVLNCEELANIAWAFAVVNVPAPSLFNDKVITALMEKENEFNTEELIQLHQWNLWSVLELDSGVCLPQSLRKRCLEAFVSNNLQPPSRIQDEVVNELFNIGLQLKEDAFLPKSGYRLAALLHVNNEHVGIEVNDGVNGKTSLKCRQVYVIDGVRIIFLYQKELSGLDNDHQKMQDHLCKKLGLWHATIENINKIIGD